MAEYQVSHRSLGAENGPKYDDDLKNLVPTLYIGLGGTGKNTLMRFRKAMYDEYHVASPACCRFLLIDGNAPEKDSVDGESNEAMAVARLDADKGEFVGCSISETVYKSTLDRVEMEHDPRFKSWLHPHFRELIPAKAVVDGAGTYRQAGRFQFFLNYSRIRDQIKAHLSDLFHMAAGKEIEVFPGRKGLVDPKKLEIVIVAGLSGGTGSGMFLDTAYMVQDIITNADPDSERIVALDGVTPHVTLIAFLPSIFTRKDPGLAQRFRQNAYAALLEMEQYCTFRPEEGGGESGKSSGAEFRVNWTGARERIIKSRPWHSCYLIDDVNDKQPGLLPDAEELYQMVADYLFLDFGNSPFAVAKRSTRSNNSQLLDKRIEASVMGEVEIRGKTQLVELFSNLYGSTFSSFGLAEIQIDRERINRAASYRLAVSILEERWINLKHSFHDDDLKTWTKVDLRDGVAPAGDSGTVQFGPDELWQELLRDVSGDKWTDRIQKSLDGLLREADPDKLRQMLDGFDSDLNSTEGPIRRTIERRFLELAGKDKNLGRLRNRLTSLARDRFQKHGVKPTLDLLMQYEAFLTACGKRTGDWRSELNNIASNSKILQRLDDALGIPMVSRWIAARIEYPRAVTAAAAALPRRCRRESVRYLELIYNQLRQFVSAPQRTNNEVVKPLKAGYMEIQSFLESVRLKLEQNYKHLSRYAGSDRKISLLPEWSDADYDREIARALILNPEVKSNKDGSAPDWQRAEAAILDRLLTSRDGGRTLPDLVDHWLEEFGRDHDFRNEVVDRLAEACRVLLGDGIGLENFAGGNVVDYLASMPPEGRSAFAVKLINAAAPYFPAAEVTRVQNFRMFCRNILGRSDGEGPKGTEKVQKIEAVIKGAATADSRDHVLDRIHDTKLLEPTRVALVRELAGFPLSLYSRLKELESAYLNKGLNDQRKTCHIKYRETYEDLPDIMLVEDEKYRSIREYVDYVFYGIVLRFIEIDEDGVFCARMMSPTIGEVIKPLGTRLNRIVKHACNNVEVRDYLKQRWTNWSTLIATPRHFAILYRALQRSRDLVRKAYKPAAYETDKKANPVLNCLLRLLNATELDLQKSDEGRQWLQLLREPNNQDDPPDVLARWQEQSPAVYRLLDELFLKLSGGGTGVPIYQIDERRIDELASAIADLRDGQLRLDVQVS